MIKIAYLYSAFGFGGIIRNLSLIVQNLNPSEFEVHIISLSASEKSAQLDTGEHTYPHLSLPDTARLDFSSLAAIEAYLAEQKIDILSCHGHKADVYGGILKLRGALKAKLVSIAHGWVTPGLKLECYYFLNKLSYLLFDKIVLVSEHQRRALSFLPLKKKIEVIHNAIAPKGFDESKGSFRTRLGLSDETIIAGFAGRFSPEKNIAHTIHAFLSTPQNIHLLLAGSGPIEDALKSLVQKLHLNKRVTFVGTQTNMEDFYKSIDIYVTSSLREGLPNGVLEAQAFEVPVIASDIRGHREIILPRETGLLVPTKKAHILGETLTALAASKEERKIIGKRALAHLKAHFDLETRIKKLEASYHEVFCDSEV